MAPPKISTVTTAMLSHLLVDEKIKRINQASDSSQDPQIQGLAREALQRTVELIGKTNPNHKLFDSTFKQAISEICVRDNAPDNAESEILEFLNKTNKYSIDFRPRLTPLALPPNEDPNQSQPEQVEESPPIIDPEKYANYSEAQPIPEEILSADITAPHTIPYDQYLDRRISGIIRSLLVQHSVPVEIFAGSQEDLENFYRVQEFTCLAELKTASSIKYYLFKNPKDGTSKIVIHGISNDSKLRHVLLQLKYSGIDLEGVIVRGRIDEAIEHNIQALETALDTCSAPLELGIVGSRWQIIAELAELLYPAEFIDLPEQEKYDIAIEILEDNHNLQTIEIGGGVFKFSYMEVYLRNGQRKGIIAFRMPNGNLSSYAVKELLNRKIANIIMTGAGGSLSSRRTLGSYQLIDSSRYLGETVSSKELNIMPLPLPEDFPVHEEGRNVTVFSPLEETKEWLRQVRRNGNTSVDVETFHILQTVARHEHQPQILPGIFTSDVVVGKGETHQPLVEKIDENTAWRYLASLLLRSFDYIDLARENLFVSPNVPAIVKIQVDNGSISEIMVQS